MIDRNPSSSSAPEAPSGLLARVPPHDIEAEMALLGSLLLDGEMVGAVVPLLRPDDFYRTAHRRLYETILSLYERGEPCDVLLVMKELEKTGSLDEAGGRELLASLANAVPTAANAEHYARLVREKSVARGVIRVTAELQRDAYEGGGGDDLLEKAEHSIFELTRTQDLGQAASVRSLLEDTFRELDRRDGSSSGISTGFLQLDDLTAGLHPGELVIVAGRPSMGKCVAAETEVVLEDGSVATIEEIVRRRAARILTLGTDRKLRFAEPSTFVDDGEKPTFRVTTRLGRVVETTASHPFLTIDGWRPLAELEISVPVAVPREIPVFGTRAMRDCEVKLLAYLIGDGGLTQSSPLFTNGDPKVSADFCSAVQEFGGVRAVLVQGNGDRTPSWRISTDRAQIRELRATFAARLRERLASCGRTARTIAREIGVSAASLTHWTTAQATPTLPSLTRLCSALGVKEADLVSAGTYSLWTNSVAGWLADLGLWGLGAAKKHVPGPVFTMPRPQLALFLNRLFATDGWLTTLRSGQVQAGYSSVSERLARQVQHLLLRFGVIAKLRRRSVRYGETRRVAFQLDVTDAPSLRVLLEQIGVFSKESACDRARMRLRSRRARPGRDTLPAAVWGRVEVAKADEPWSALGRRAGIAGWTNLHRTRGGPGRERLAQLATALADDDLRELASSDVLWDPIVSIEPLGPKRVYDLTIPATHNFVANDICLHNTTFALNVAYNVAVHAKVPTAIFSLEMSKQQITKNVLCSHAMVEAHKLRGGRFLDDKEFARLTEAAGPLYDAAMFVDDTPGLSTTTLRAKARRLKQKHDIGLLVIDYMQLMEAMGASKNVDSRQQEISYISRSLKGIARELDVPVIALSQLNRAADAREDHRPRMSDLRESGSIEQDADVICFLYRKHYYTKADQDKGIAEVIVAKQRNGPTDTVRLAFLDQFMRFDNLAIGDVPPGL